jgi:hypothetical protein
VPRTAQAENQVEQNVGSIELEPPAPLTAEQVQALVARTVSEALAGAVPAMMAEMLKASVPNYGAAPSQAVHIPTSPDAPVKADYLKKYRLDGVVSGKYQMLNMFKLGNRDIDDLDAEEIKDVMMKGKYFHFQNGYAFAVSENDVEFVERYLKPRGVRIYEDDSGPMFPCTVVNCGMQFGSEAGLMAHREATHGLTRGQPNA